MYFIKKLNQKVEYNFYTLFVFDFAFKIEELNTSAFHVKENLFYCSR